MTSINSKLGLKPAGARARLNSLSGVKCAAACGHTDTVSVIIHKRLTWCCGWCSHQWQPSPAEVVAYNARCRPHDRIEIK